jgi:hypothetical protein
MRELKLTACLYFQFRPKTPPQNIHTTGMKFRANKALLDIYEQVKFVISEGTDYSDELAHLYYSSISFRISGNGDNI